MSDALCFVFAYAIASTSTKHPALRLRGGRRTPLRAIALRFLYSFWVLRGNAQFSNEPLLPLERIAVGGRYTVRGYRENQLVRDQGYTLSTEFHYPLYGGTDPKANYRLALVPFMDYGAAWNHGVGETLESLHSVGVGLDWQFKPVHAEVYYGYALNRPKPSSKGDLQDEGVHFQVRMDVF